MDEIALFDWSAFEEELFEECHHALARLGRERPEARFYAVALHGADGELDGFLSLPLLAAAIETDPPRADDAALGFASAYWNPADWELREIPLRESPALRLEQALTAEATRSTQGHWNEVDTRYREMLVRVALRLRDAAPALLRTTDEFVLFLSDEDGGPEWAARTIPAALFARLFAKDVAVKREHDRVMALPAPEQAAFLVTRFGRFDGLTSEAAQVALLNLGERALDALLPVIKHPTHGWTAAMLVGRIGVSRPDLVAELRRRAPKSHWHAMALGMLGDDEWLASQPPSVAAYGYAAPLREICAGRPRPLDYRPLERYLDGAPAAAHVLVEEELAPGSSYVAAHVEDVPEALRGLGSRHAVIRWHAASLLGERGLGDAVAERVLPALAAALSDENAIVGASPWWRSPIGGVLPSPTNRSWRACSTIPTSTCGTSRRIFSAPLRRTRAHPDHRHQLIAEPRVVAEAGLRRPRVRRKMAARERASPRLSVAHGSGSRPTVAQFLQRIAPCGQSLCAPLPRGRLDWPDATTRAFSSPRPSDWRRPASSWVRGKAGTPTG